MTIETLIEKYTAQAQDYEAKAAHADNQAAEGQIYRRMSAIYAGVVFDLRKYLEEKDWQESIDKRERLEREQAQS
jgi:hypothetical protein